MKRVIEISGTIEKYGYSADYVQYMISKLGEGPITVKVSSLGGDMMQALKIKDLFAEHGDVTVEYVSFNASAATLLGHGAKKSIIAEDSFYLIHKPMLWVEAWGSLNEDQLEAEIANLKAAKKDAETITLSMINEYVKARQMDFDTVRNLMKEGRWLSAKEAVELGLVDELRPTKGRSSQEPTAQMVAMMKANDLPVPEMKTEPATNNSILEKFTNIFKSQSHTKMEKKYQFINETLSVESVEVKGDSVTLSLQQVEMLDAKIGELKASAESTDNEKKTAEEAKTIAENSLADVIAKMDSIGEEVKKADTVEAKLSVIKKMIADKPADKPDMSKGTHSSNATSTFEDNDNYSFNKEADSLWG